MPERLVWEEIKNQYPEQWVSIVEPEGIKEQGVMSGIVIGCNKDKKILSMETKKKISEGLKFKIHTMVFTGEIPYLAGLSRLEIKSA